MKWQERRRLFHALRFFLQAATSTDFRSIGISAPCFIKEGLALSSGEAEIGIVLDYYKWIWQLLPDSTGGLTAHYASTHANGTDRSATEFMQ
jgi:hypothetical protein